MPNEKARLSFVMEVSLLKQLQDYRFEHRYNSMSDCIRFLLEAGLKAQEEKKTPSPTKRRRGV